MTTFTPETYLPAFILQVNSAIDKGRHADVSVEEVKLHIRRFDLMPFLAQRLGDDIDLSLFDEAAPPTDPAAQPRPTWQIELQARLHKDLRDVLEFGEGRERRKWGVVNSGLCLLVAWSLEALLQPRPADAPGSPNERPDLDAPAS